MDPLLQAVASMRLSRRALKERTQRIEEEILQQASPALSKFLLSHTTGPGPSLSQRLRSNPALAGLLASALFGGVAAAAHRSRAKRRATEQLFRSRQEVRNVKIELNEESEAFELAMRELLAKEQQDTQEASARRARRKKISVQVQATLAPQISAARTHLQNLERINQGLLADRESLVMMKQQFEKMALLSEELKIQIGLAENTSEKLQREQEALEARADRERMAKLGPIGRRMLEQDRLEMESERKLLAIKASISQKQINLSKSRAAVSELRVTIEQTASAIEKLAVNYSHGLMPVPVEVRSSPQGASAFVKDMAEITKSLLEQVQKADQAHHEKLQLEQNELTSRQSALAEATQTLATLRDIQSRLESSRLARTKAEEALLLKKAETTKIKDSIRNESVNIAHARAHISNLNHQAEQEQKVITQLTTKKSELKLAIAATKKSLLENLDMDPSAEVTQIMEKLKVQSEDFTKLQLARDRYNDVLSQRDATLELERIKTELAEQKRAIKDEEDRKHELEKVISALQKRIEASITLDAWKKQEEDFRAKVDTAKKRLKSANAGDAEKGEASEIEHQVASAVFKLRKMFHGGVLAMQVSKDVLDAPAQYRSYLEEDTPLRILLACTAFPEATFPIGRRMINLPLRNSQFRMPHAILNAKTQLWSTEIISRDEEAHKKLLKKLVVHDHENVDEWIHDLVNSQGALFALKVGKLSLVLFTVVEEEMNFRKLNPNLKRAFVIKMLYSEAAEKFSTQENGLTPVLKIYGQYEWAAFNIKGVLVFDNANRLGLFKEFQNTLFPWNEPITLMRNADTEFEKLAFNTHLGFLNGGKAKLSPEDEPITDIRLQLQNQTRALGTFTFENPRSSLAPGEKILGTLVLDDFSAQKGILELTLPVQMPRTLTALGFPFLPFKKRLARMLNEESGYATNTGPVSMGYQMGFQLKMREIPKFTFKNAEDHQPRHLWFAESQIPMCPVAILGREQMKGSSILSSVQFQKQSQEEERQRIAIIKSHKDTFGGTWGPYMLLEHTVHKIIAEIVENVDPEIKEEKETVEIGRRALQISYEGRLDELYFANMARYDEQEIKGSIRNNAASALINRSPESVLWSLVQKFDPGKWAAVTSVSEFAKGFRPLSKALADVMKAVPSNESWIHRLNKVFSEMVLSENSYPRSKIVCLHDRVVDN